MTLYRMSEDVVKMDVLNDISPVPGTLGYQTVLRSLPTPFLTEWSAKREEARREHHRLRSQIVELAADQFFDELTRARARTSVSIRSNQLSKKSTAISDAGCEESGFVVVIVMAWSPI